jgi:hypothetical protein
MQKLYCYVDESGQDATSEVFIVVAIVSDQDQAAFRQECLAVEESAVTGKRKWHKSRPERRWQYLELVLEGKLGQGQVFFGQFKKPLPYFLPLLETIEKAIKDVASKDYQATIYIDGIDRQKAAEMTNALRIRGIKLRLVRSQRDEAEPLIRLADMWAGCIRAALLGRTEENRLQTRAVKAKYLKEITKIPS